MVEKFINSSGKTKDSRLPFGNYADELYHLLDSSGKLESFGITNDLAINIYKTAVLNRLLDNKILSLQRQGRLGAYIASTGEEGAIVGSAYALDKGDWLFSSYRELGAHLVRGLSIDLVLAQLYGNSNDLLKGRQMSNSWGDKKLRSVPTAAPIGAYLPVAVGTAIASKIRNDAIATLTYFGDGATSSSDFHVAMNFAGVYKAPIVFFCRNNGWAISVPLSKQTASHSIAIKAIAYGFEGIRVDGNDALACYAVTRQALENARKGGGPVFIEATTYRVGPHSTSDDPTRYRKDRETEAWLKKDPILLMKSYLTKKGLWNGSMETVYVEQCNKIISDSIRQQESYSPLSPAELIFDDVFADMPRNLKEQREQL